MCALEIGSILKATDADGDSVNLNGDFTITVKDDILALGTGTVTARVDENDLNDLGIGFDAGTSFGSTGRSPGDNADGSVTNADGTAAPQNVLNLAPLVTTRAGEPVTVGFQTDAITTLTG